MSAISYKIFGVNTFAYKFPAVLFVLLGAIYTFFFTRRLYSALHGFIAVLILITAQHIIISTRIVRAEPIFNRVINNGIVSFVMVIEQNRNKILHLVLGSLAVASGSLACLS